jgi:hypothetical protein
MDEEEHILDMAAGDYKNHLLMIARYKAFADAVQPYLAKDDKGRDLMEQVKALKTERDALLQTVGQNGGEANATDTGRAAQPAVHTANAGKSRHSKPRA